MTTADAPTVRSIEQTPHYTFGVIENVIVAVTRSPPLVEGVDRFVRECRNLARDHPDGIVVVVAPRAPRPRLSAEVTKHVVAGSRRMEAQMLGAVLWMGSHGFVAAIVQSIMATLVNAGLARTKKKVASSADETAQFIAEVDPAHARHQDALARALREFVERESQRS